MNKIDGSFIGRYDSLTKSGVTDWKLKTHPMTKYTCGQKFFETHRKAIGLASKPKSRGQTVCRNQIIKWLKNLPKGTSSGRVL